ARFGRELRLQAGAALTFALALGYALWVEAPPRELFVAVAHPGGGVPALLFLAAAAGVFAYCASGGTRVRLSWREPVSGRDLAAWLGGSQSLWRAAALWLGAVLALYSASLALLELFVRVATFEWGHVGLAGLWAGTALVVLEWGVRRRILSVELASVALLTATLAEVLAFDAVWLSRIVWGCSFLVLGAGLLLAGYEYGRLSHRRERLFPAGTAIVASAALGGAALVALAHGDWHRISTEGACLAGLALLYGGFSISVSRSQRDLSTLLWTVALAFAVAGGSELLTGRWLVLAGAGVVAGLAILAWLGREARLRAAAAAVFGLSLGYALAVEAPPRELFVAVAHPAQGVPALLFLVGAAVVFATLRRDVGRPVAGAIAGALSLYAISLSILELFVWRASFAWGHVGLAGFWAGVALLLLERGVRGRAASFELVGFALLAATLAEVVAFDAFWLARTVWASSFLALAAGLLLAGYEYGRLAPWRYRLAPAGTAIVTSAALAAAAVVALAHGEWQGIASEGGALLALALLFAAFSAPVARSQRDLSTLLWALALALATAALAELLVGRWLVLAGAALVALLALLARFGRELRLQAGAALTFALALGYALWVEAPPRELFVAVAHPGGGVPALLFLAAAAGVFAYGPELVRHARSVALGTVGTVLFYAVSLSILELAELATGADMDTEFQRGHTGVSAFWGLVSLSFLYLGLTRRSRALRLGGFALFGVTLAKIFLYDLAFLSSLTRALSFIAVGTVLLLAGFFYQRVSEQLEERDRTRAPGAPPDNAAA
ncbi:MAG TPA: DUF2339 domain-containing protein, partial [Gaiellaceae bacterium]|nr:DUF2339 domain-containing protein [Gaiellaceae bacterium]